MPEMKNSSTISSKGQVTVPQEIRNRIGLFPRRPCGIRCGKGQTAIRPLRSETNPFEKYRGALKSFRSRKEINAWVREMRDEGKDRD
jgi:bifunctional DNA-binding transcriptional regulator/antitoxin component of YhaV-PrlF toxin-antitoxin module